MSDVNDPIYCFNDTECTYEKAGGCYDHTLRICRFEWLKGILKAGILVQSTPPLPRNEGAAPTQRTPFRRVEPKAESPKGDYTPYSAIKKGAKGVKVSGKIESIEEKEVTTKNGPTDILKVHLSNGREKIVITFWNKDKVPDIREGDEVEFSGLMGSDPYNGTAQASGGDYVKVVVK